MTTMNALLLSKKLRARRVELRKQHTDELKKFDVNFVQWKRAMQSWAAQVMPANIERMKKSDISPRHYSHSFDSVLLTGYPKPPARPSDEVIRKIDAKLRHIAITGQTKVEFTEHDAALYFGSEDEES